MLVTIAIYLSSISVRQEPATEWGPRLAEKLVQVGILSEEVRLRSRYEIAVAGYAGYKSLEGMLPKILAGERPARLKDWWLQIDGIVRCFQQLQPEMRSMAVFDDKKPEAYVTELRKLQSKYAEYAAGGKTAPKWAEEARWTLAKSGHGVGLDLMGHHGRPLTRYEHAVGAHATYMHLKNLLADTKRVPLTPEDVGAMKGWSDDITLLAKLFAEFRPELTAMQVYETTTPDAIRAEIADMNKQVVAYTNDPKPFADVPADHWAAGALRDLKAHGLIRGYPDGKFGGGLKRP
jgi:S-layer homology domain